MPLVAGKKKENISKTPVKLQWQLWNTRTDVFLEMITMTKSPGNQVVEKEAAVKLATDWAIHLYQDPEFSMETRDFINKITRSPLQFYAVIFLFRTALGQHSRMQHKKAWAI